MRRQARSFGLCLWVAALTLLPASWSAAQPAAVATSPAPALAAATTSTPNDDRTLLQWLERLHDAGRSRSYAGTFVVSSANGHLSSARIAHVCDGRQQIEHVESLTGPPRHTFRRDSQVVTFWPHRKLVVIEQRDSLQVFPQRLRTVQPALAEFYALRRLGPDRVAGFDADVLQLDPRDGLRFGYRIWSERRTGLVVQMQTLAPDGQVLEQSAFSELKLDAPVRMERLARRMERTEGYRVMRLEPVKTTPEAEGWALRQPVPGFESTGCQRRVHPGAASTDGPGAVQWTFSDGLATVSLFIEPLDRQRHTHELSHGSGATQLISRRLGDGVGGTASAGASHGASPGADSGAWWLTAVGEVPRATLEAFARSLERRR